MIIFPFLDFFRTSKYWFINLYLVYYLPVLCNDGLCVSHPCPSGLSQLPHERDRLIAQSRPSVMSPVTNRSEVGGVSGPAGVFKGRPDQYETAKPGTRVTGNRSRRVKPGEADRRRGTVGDTEMSSAS